MAKNKTIFVCNACGNESPKWMGQCSACGEWNTFVEEQPIKTSTGKILKNKLAKGEEPKNLKSIEINEENRVKTNINELDRVLGGGIVNGSMILVGGDPGIGKSTIILQMCKTITEQNFSILYVSGEESLKQIKLRANRLEVNNEQLFLLAETSVEMIEQCVTKHKPKLLIIDSIQTIYSESITSAAGSVSQVREVTSRLMHLSKGQDISTFIIGHVTKEGAIAGPRVLEHMVDTVLYFEGERSAAYRVLRAVKNRFGSTNEIGIFEMAESGLVEVTNPSEYMLNGRPIGESGSIITCCIEGTRAMLVEVQALVCPTNFGMPRRTSTGTDYNRVNMLMAVVEKKMGIQLGDYDSYINIAGGIKIQEPSLDLAIVGAILSSFKNQSVEATTVIFGEVGLTGEVRGITMSEKRIIESKKLGFRLCIVPQANYTSHYDDKHFMVIGINNIRELYNHLF